jgi:hypothetical protein
MSESPPQDNQEHENPMSHPPTSAAEARFDTLLNSPVVRPEAVARARQLLASAAWCHAEEVAAQLVDCLVDHRLP